jgi:hypothetical protein
VTASTLPGVPAPVPVPSAPARSVPARSVSARVTRFRLSVLLGAALFAPAAFLVLRGNLSVTDALMRFGCALLVAAAGTALVLATVPAEDLAGDAPPAAAAPDEPAAADVTPG